MRHSRSLDTFWRNVYPRFTVAPTCRRPRLRRGGRACIRRLGRVDVLRSESSCVSRRRLRSILSVYLGCDPDDVRFGIGPFGKPELDRRGAGRPLEFNISHCGDRCLIAVSQPGQIGVDLERRRLIGDLSRIAGLYFTPAESRMIADSDAGQRLGAFFDCWTFKEAYTKALGTGLLTPLDSFAFPSSASRTGVTRARIHGREWTLHRFEPWAGYTASVVVAGCLNESAFHLADEYVDDC